jgi:hypothetical protein
VNRNLIVVFFSSLVATINPSLLAAVTVMLLLPHPKRLMLGYLLGAFAASIAAGLAIVFALHGSSAARTSRHTASPGEDIVLAVVVWGIAVGAVLSFPGVSYFNALDHIVKLNPPTIPILLLVAYFCLMQQILLEAPLVAYLFAPQRTQAGVTRFKTWLGHRGRLLAEIALTAIGVFLILRGLGTIA